MTLRLVAKTCRRRRARRNLTDILLLQKVHDIWHTSCTATYDAGKPPVKASREGGTPGTRISPVVAMASCCPASVWKLGNPLEDLDIFLHQEGVSAALFAYISRKGLGRDGLAGAKSIAVALSRQGFETTSCGKRTSIPVGFFSPGSGKQRQLPLPVCRSATPVADDRRQTTQWRFA